MEFIESLRSPVRKEFQQEYNKIHYKEIKVESETDRQVPGDFWVKFSGAAEKARLKELQCEWVIIK